MSKPFNGAVSRFHEMTAPQKVRDAVAAARRSRMVAEGYRYEKRLDRRAYDAEMTALQHQLIRAVLARVEYDGKDPDIAAPPDAKIAGGLGIWPYELDG